MSKARAKARRQRKENRKTGEAGQSRVVFWTLLVLAALLLLGGAGYVLVGQATQGDGSAVPLPPATLAGELATVAAEATTAANASIAADPSPGTFLAETSATTVPAGPADYCRRHPRFARQLGFNERAILMTSAPTIKGLAMIQPAEGTEAERVYQDPTWDDAGYLGHMTFDAIGNVYLFPSPRVSLIDNPPEQQNTLYRVDTDAATMTPWLTLTNDLPISVANPFGLMGTFYDCDTGSLYAATVAGSTAGEEVGKIVRVDLETASVMAELQGIDPFGLSVYNDAYADALSTSNASGAITDVHKRLYFGAARAAEVYSVALEENGDFAGQPQLELALPDPALKAWRIVWDTNGDLIVRAMPFDYNLIATSERIEVLFRFRRDTTGLWQYVPE